MNIDLITYKIGTNVWQSLNFNGHDSLSNVLKHKKCFLQNCS